MRKFCTFCLLLCLNCSWLNAQDTTAHRLSTKKLALYGGLTYGATLTGLSVAWYSENGFTNFRFFNDNAEWNQMDKFGHAFGTYQFSRIGYEMLKKTDLDERKSLYWATGVSFAMLLPIEILDGFSEDYGFSYGDIIANLVGSGLSLGEQLLWNEQRIKLKYSFHQTSYAALRPNLLGNGLHEEFLKDYNGQTYWLSFDVHAFFKESKFPKWLNIAAGYGAEGMVYAREDQNNLAGYESHRQYYLGLDFDLSYIPTKSKFLKTLLFLADMVKLPAPAIEITKNGIQGHLFYY